MDQRHGLSGLAAAGIAVVSLAFCAGAVAAPGHTPGPLPSAPGQAKKVAPATTPPAATPAHPSHPAHPSKSAKSAHSSAPAHPAHPSHPATPAASTHASAPAAKPHTTPASPHAKAGKETICHATGSATNPYVEITISRNAIPAHTRHQDGRDIIPAPAGGCPGASAAAKPSTATATPSAAPAATSAAPAASTVAAALQHSTVHRTGSRGTVKVLGVRNVGGPTRVAARVRALTQSMRGKLPFTGLEVFGVFALGALLLGSGLAVRSRT